MANVQIDKPPQLTPAVQALLGGLRRRIRQYVWLEGMAAGAVWLGAAFWASLAIDWLFEPPPPIRAMLLAAVALVLAAVLVRYIGRRAFVPLSDSNMATLLERRFPQLDDTLLTSVVLSPRRPEEAGYNAEMLARTCSEAERRLAVVALPEVFNPMPLAKKVVIALGLVSAIVGLALAAPEALETWVRRDLLLGEKLWPRKIRLEPVGFDHGVAKVASGADFDLVVQAFRGDTEVAILPQSVEVRYRIEGGARGRHTMNRLGVGAVSRGPEEAASWEVLQEYGHTFHGVLAPVRLDIVGGDVHLRDYQIQVVPNPTLTQLDLECEYPAYMDRPPRTLPAAGTVQIPVGTRLTVRGRANKPLKSVRIEMPSADRHAAEVRQLEGEALAPDGMQLALRLDPLQRDTTLLFTLLDADGIKSREPIPLALVAVPDEPPQVAARLVGIGSAVTPQARIPMAGRVTDDYGIAKTWFEHAVDKQPPGTTLLAALPKHPTDLPLVDAALEVRDLKLTRGQKLSVVLKAADLYDLNKGPNVGSSETWLLDVVSPEELRSMLEARELVLRQRFEAIMQETGETRDLLVRMEFSGHAESGAKREKTGAAATEGTQGVPGPIFAPRKSGQSPASRSAGQAASGAEPGEAPPPVENLAPAELLARRTERVLQTLQNCRKNAQETMGVAESFDDIRQQLTNNRVETEELKNRLGAGIAEPLRRIAEAMFPELEQRLESLQAAVADAKAGPARRDAARQQADEILLAMRRVLSRMVELEDFNELVERLRTIIQIQEQITAQTKERQKQRIRDLLEK